MDHYSRLHYEREFRAHVLHEVRGEAFQELFASVMECRYPGDFQRIRTWGPRGDEKCDGYLRSTKTVYQVYAPDVTREAEMLRKIKEDFEGARAAWGDRMEAWVFVHNGEGLGPRQFKAIQDLDTENPAVAVSAVGYPALRKFLFELDDADIELLLGPAPTPAAVAALEFEDVKFVTSAIAGKVSRGEVDLRPPPAEKLAVNWFAEETEDFLRYGMRGADTVATYFARHHDPTFGDSVAHAFASRYMELRRDRQSPDEIFAELLAFSGMHSAKTPQQIAAVYAVVAHLFEQCDIFERPPSEVET